MPPQRRENAEMMSVSLISMTLLHALPTPDPETKAMIVLMAAYALCQLWCFLGPMRRSTNHWLVQYGSMAAYHFSPALLFYATSIVVFSPDNDTVLFLIINSQHFLFILRDTVVMRAYSLRDGPVPAWRLLSWAMCIFSLKWRYIWRKAPYLLFTYTMLELINLFLGSREPWFVLANEAKEFSEYMKKESISASPFFDYCDANNMQNGCKYPIIWDYNRSITTIKDLLQDDCTVDPDIYLSISFSQLIARRYFELDCAEEGDAKVRNFVLKQLLQNPEDRRAFNIVEVQLAFLHDSFFTCYRSNIVAAFLSVKEAIAFRIIVAVLVAFIFTCLSLTLDLHTSGILDYVTVATLSFLYIFIGLPQIRPVMPTYWHPMVKDTLSPADWLGRLLGLHGASSSVSAPRVREYYWRNKIGQYSILEDYDRCSVKKALIVRFKEYVLSQVSPVAPLTRHHPVEEEDVSVPDSVRSFVAHALQVMDGLPTNGTRSLKSNADMVQKDLTWTCREKTHTHTILIWHIATCYCDMFSDSERTRRSPCYEVAMKLSRYCAYLVAFIPEVLPEPSFKTTVTFQEVLQEAQGLLGEERMSMEEKRRKIQGLQLLEVEARKKTFEKGIGLGQELLSLNNNDDLLLWKVMTEFWAETILYMAPSDNAEAHIDRLAKGGEFVLYFGLYFPTPASSRGNGVRHSRSRGTEKRQPAIGPQPPRNRGLRCSSRIGTAGTEGVGAV